MDRIQVLAVILILCGVLLVLAVNNVVRGRRKGKPVWENNLWIIFSVVFVAFLFNMFVLFDSDGNVINIKRIIIVFKYKCKYY